MPLLYRVAKRLTGNAAEAEDLVGQTLLSAYGAWERFDGSHPRSWMIRILTNCHLKILRAGGGRAPSVELDPERVGKEPWHAIDWSLCGPQLMAEVDRLPQEFRLAVVLCDIEEMSYQEAADALEVAVGTLKSRLFRGRRTLRARLAGMMEGVIV